MSRLSLLLLGVPEVELAGEPITVDLRKALALLVYLAETGRSHSRDSLATLFWPELSQSRARAGLRYALAALRRALGDDWLETDREMVSLRLDADIWVDVQEFGRLIAECGTHGHEDSELCPNCLAALGEAAALYRDDFMTGFTLRDCPSFDEWQYFRSEDLRNDLAGVLERLVAGHAARGAFEQAIAHARRRLTQDMLHEPAHRQLMRLYSWSGQRGAALRQYDECWRILADELGATPEEETTELYRITIRPETLRKQQCICSGRAIGHAGCTLMRTRSDITSKPWSF